MPDFSDPTYSTYYQQLRKRITLARVSILEPKKEPVDETVQDSVCLNVVLDDQAHGDIPEPTDPK